MRIDNFTHSLNSVERILETFGQVAGPIDPNYIHVHFLQNSQRAFRAKIYNKLRCLLFFLLLLLLFFGHFIQESKSSPSDFLRIILCFFCPPSRSCSSSSSGGTTQGVAWSLWHCKGSRSSLSRGGSFLGSFGTGWRRSLLQSTWSCSCGCSRGNRTRCRVFGFMPACLNRVDSRSFSGFGSLWLGCSETRGACLDGWYCAFGCTCTGRFRCS